MRHSCTITTAPMCASSPIPRIVKIGAIHFIGSIYPQRLSFAPLACSVLWFSPCPSALVMTTNDSNCANPSFVEPASIKDRMTGLTGLTGLTGFGYFLQNLSPRRGVVRNLLTPECHAMFHRPLACAGVNASKTFCHLPFAFAPACAVTSRGLWASVGLGLV